MELRCRIIPIISLRVLISSSTNQLNICQIIEMNKNYLVTESNKDEIRKQIVEKYRLQVLTLYDTYREINVVPNYESPSIIPEIIM